MPEPTIIQAAACAYARQHRRLIPRFNFAKLERILTWLSEDQQNRLDNQQPVSPIPLLWVAIAETSGLRIDIATGRILDGPKEQLTPRSDPAQCRVCNK